MHRIFETEHLIWRLHGEVGVSDDQLGRLESSAMSHLKAARKAAEGAYVPYSKFRVGASVEACRDGEKLNFTGCNVENASYGATMCAERVAIFSAVAQQLLKFDIMTLSTLDSANEADLSRRSPCGLCRQVMSEFFDVGTLVLIDGGTEGKERDRVDVTGIDSLLPWRFEL